MSVVLDVRQSLCCRLCSALGVPTTNQASHTAKTLREKMDALKAEVG